MNATYPPSAQMLKPVARISRILAPTDFSVPSKAAVNATVAMLEANPEASLTLMHAVDPGASAAEEGIGDDLERCHLAFRVHHAEKLMKHLRAAYGNDSELDARIVTGDAAHAICSLARDENYDLIVMSSHGRIGLAGMLIGSVAERVVQEAPCAILVMKPATSEDGEFLEAAVPLKFTRLVVGYDHRAGAQHALDMARELTRSKGGHITLVHALEPVPAMSGCSGNIIPAERLQEALEELGEVRRQRLPAAREWDLRVEIGEPWEVLTRIARETRSHLIIVGPHEHTRWGHSYAGSTAQRVVRFAQCPVLVVK